MSDYLKTFTLTDSNHYVALASNPSSISNNIFVKYSILNSSNYSSGKLEFGYISFEDYKTAINEDTPLDFTKFSSNPAQAFDQTGSEYFLIPKKCFAIFRLINVSGTADVKLEIQHIGNENAIVDRTNIEA